MAQSWEAHLAHARRLKAQFPVLAANISVEDLAMGGVYKEAFAEVARTPDPEIEFDELMLSFA